MVNGRPVRSDGKLPRRRRRAVRRWTALVAAAVVVAATAAPGRTPTAEAATPAPAATGWRVTSQSSGAGIEVSTISRVEPLARGIVAVIPRDQLHRLRTVLASEQLVNGTGLQLTTSLCARVHCEIGVNGDRFQVTGTEVNRLSGALAIDGELVATQPRPPDGLAAHLLIDGDGSMEGTISFQLPLDPAVSAGEASIPVDVNRQPSTAYTSVLTTRYSSQTYTQSGTVEYVLSVLGGSADELGLEPVVRREQSGPIDPASVVVAATGPDAIAQADAWWAEALRTNQATFRPGLNGYQQVIGGSPLLLDGGSYGFPETDSDGRHARTIIGWDATRVWLVTVDGRQAGWSAGLTLVESAQLMRWLGASDALNLDGGGSTAFAGFGGGLANRPSDGFQRRVAEALVFMPPENRIAAPPSNRSLDGACPPGRVPPDPFVDVTGGVHAPTIACMAWWGVATGTGGGRYEPLAAVRRDQMATFIARYLYASGAALPASPPDAFPDDDGSVHEGAINALTALGVIGGRSDGTYGPSAPVTRGQMASFLARAVPIAIRTPLPDTADYFADDSGDVHERDINTVTEAGIAGGLADGRYGARDAVRRDQMASFLARSLGASVDAGVTAPPP